MIISEHQRQWFRNNNPTSGVLLLCSIYVIFALLLLTMAALAPDDKSQMIWMQLAVMPFSTFVDRLNLEIYTANLWLDIPIGFMGSLLLIFVTLQLITWFWVLIGMRFSTENNRTKYQRGAD